MFYYTTGISQYKRKFEEEVFLPSDVSDAPFTFTGFLPEN
jgi:hypothetical protein